MEMIVANCVLNVLFDIFVRFLRIYVLLISCIFFIGLLLYLFIRSYYLLCVYIFHYIFYKVTIDARIYI